VKPWVAPLAALVLVALGALWFNAKFERVPDRQWSGSTGEARRDPFLAAGRFAERMGLPARQARTLLDLDQLPADGVLLLAARRQAIDPGRLRRIAAWVESGGHLIAEAELPGVADPLFDRLGVERRAAPPAFKPPAVQTVRGRRLKVSLFSRTLLQLPPGEVLYSAGGGKDGVLLASLEHGEGTLTVASSLGFARNGLIGDADNAEFFWHLLQLAPAQELVVFLRQERLSLWGFLRQHATPVLLATAALLALWLWHIGPRFGPVAPDAPPARRRLLDHLRASGRFYWAKGLRSRLVVAARDAALHHVARAHPDFAFASPADRIAHVSSLVSISADEAERFLRAAGAASGAEFIQLMHTAQQIHSALEKGTR
jgi:hypothetical protein